MSIVIRSLTEVEVGKWRFENLRHGAGSFGVRRIGKSDFAFYFRYRDSKGRRDTYPLGKYDRDGRMGMTLAEARDRAGALARRHAGGERDIRIVLEAEALAVRLANERALREREIVEGATFGRLLNGYVRKLELGEQPSARDTETGFYKHIMTPFPDLWSRPAVEITRHDVVMILTRLVDAKKPDRADKIRSHIRAAFAAAINAPNDPASPSELREFDLPFNPAADIKRIKRPRSRKKPALTLEELRALWMRIEKLETPHGALLRFYLLTGAQRFAQLARVDVRHYGAISCSS